LANLKKLDVLEEKFAKTAEKFEKLNARCQALVARTVALESEIESLRSRNTELTDEIKDIKTKAQTDSEISGRKQEIIKRIDRMIEKFGELQI